MPRPRLALWALILAKFCAVSARRPRQSSHGRERGRVTKSTTPTTTPSAALLAAPSQPSVSNAKPSSHGTNGGMGAGIAAAATTVSPKWQAIDTGTLLTAPALISNAAEPEQVALSGARLAPLNVMA